MLYVLLNPPILYKVDKVLNLLPLDPNFVFSNLLLMLVPMRFVRSLASSGGKQNIQN